MIPSGLVQNLTIEERVAVLEGQVVIIQDELSDIETDVDFLFDEQIIQDERLLNLEEETSVVNEEVEGLCQWVFLCSVCIRNDDNSMVQSSLQMVEFIHKKVELCVRQLHPFALDNNLCQKISQILTEIVI